ncbi:hypothetical protein [Conexibacter woesei]|nr:hypothetical protein [Conexibacter woesei]
MLIVKAAIGSVRLVTVATYTMFPVPTERVEEVARYLFAAVEPAPEPQPESYEPESAEERDELLRRVYVESEPMFRRLLHLIAEREDPSEPMSYADIGSAMEFTSARSLPGMLGAYGRRSKFRYRGWDPFRRSWDGEAWSHYLAMDPDVAALVRRLYAEHGD